MAKYAKTGEFVELRDGRKGVVTPDIGTRKILVVLDGGIKVHVWVKDVKVVESIYRKNIPLEDGNFTD